MEKIKRLIPKTPKSEEKVLLTFQDGKKAELPIYRPVLGAPMIDIQNLHKETGHFTYDPGFTCSGSCASTITYIDADKGQLMYRGYDIADLAENCSYSNISLIIVLGWPNF